MKEGGYRFRSLGHVVRKDSFSLLRSFLLLLLPPGLTAWLPADLPACVQLTGPVNGLDAHLWQLRGSAIPLELSY